MLYCHSFYSKTIFLGLESHNVYSSYFPFLDLGATLYTITPTVLITVNFIYLVYEVVTASSIPDNTVPTYSQEIAEKTQEYQWMSGRIEMFKADYESGVQKFLSGYKD